MTIFLVRHGQDKDNAQGLFNGRRDEPLTEHGIEQVKHAAKKLKKAKISIIYTSPLKRARQSAEIIAKAIHLKHLHILPELVERDFGSLSGKHISETPKYARKVLPTKSFLYVLEGEGVETFPQVYLRAQATLGRILKEPTKGNILIVVHNDVGKMLQAVINGWSWEKALKTTHLNNAQVLEYRLDH